MENRTIVMFLFILYGKTIFELFNVPIFSGKIIIKTVLTFHNTNITFIEKLKEILILLNHI